MSRVPRRTTPRRNRSAEPSVREPLVSDEEKRRLILAHAAARGTRPEQWGLGYYVAIAASCLVVATGWMMTIGSGIRSGVPNASDSILQTLRENWEKREKELRVIQEALSNGTRQPPPASGKAQENAMRGTAERITSMNRAASTTE